MISNFFDEDESCIQDENTYILTVTQLNRYVNDLISEDELLQHLSIEGEISGFKRYYGSGHCYFTLKDKEASVNCVMFKSYAGLLNFTPNDGMRVIITGSVSLYARDGKFQFYVQAMHSVGDGDIYARFLQLKEKLESEGLFSEEHKKKIPYLPQTIGVVTSRSGAVLQDIRNVIGRRFPNMNIILSPCSVQGQNAPSEIISALKILDESNSVDVIILGRGGGSMEDLQCFNDEALARAIYACNTPVISAVGHETDYTIADFAADKRDPTPSAAAESAVPVYSELVKRLDDIHNDIYHAVEEKIGHISKQISLIERGISTPEDIISMKEIKLSQIIENIELQVKNRLDKAEMHIKALALTADALSPTQTLLRGFSYVRSEDGECITKSAELIEKQKGRVVFADGEVTVKVI